MADGSPHVPACTLYFRRCFPILILLLPLLFGGVPAGAATSIESAGLEAGYRQMYNLDFDAAHQTFVAWEHAHPEDPLGPVSNAAAYLFAEFDRLHILESELFVDNAKFEHRKSLAPNVEVRNAFESELQRGEQAADRVLARSPEDHSAIFAKVMVGGLRGDYLALVEKRNIAALSTIKSSRTLAEKLLSEDPSYYDAYLAIGVENYLLSVNSAPVRWILRLTGARTDKEEGLAKLRLTAQHGRYLAPYARLLLAVAALRDHDRTQARSLLSGLATEFPRNPLYRRELARIDQ
ncbi:MAG TPA: hypothetical protein VLL05_17240 [Terriglobales bacterium]|nr:hypothetical protein [Terriglobales bacterium]